jgi:hypothetical protein
LEGKEGGGSMSTTSNGNLGAIMTRYGQLCARTDELSHTRGEPDIMTAMETGLEEKSLYFRREVLAFQASRLSPRDASEALFLIGIAPSTFDAVNNSTFDNPNDEQALTERAKRCMYRVADWLKSHGGDMPKTLEFYTIPDYCDPKKGCR